MATVTVETFTDREAHDARRSYINGSHRVSLVAYDPDRDLYIFDVYDVAEMPR